MNPLTFFCLLFGIHILMARGVTAIESKFNYYWLLGCVEGIPLIITGMLVIFEISWAFLFFIFALVLYFGGSFIKTKLDNNAKIESPDKWLTWEQEKKKINLIKRIIFLIF